MLGACISWTSSQDDNLNEIFEKTPYIGDLFEVPRNKPRMNALMNK